MQLSITGKQIDIGAALRTYVTQKVTQSVGKYFDRPVDGAVTFSRDGHEYRADCMVHLSSGLHLQAQGRSADIYASFDSAIERMDKRLRRYKGRIRDHHNGSRASVALSPAREHIIAGDADESASEPETLNPVIVSENMTQLKTLTVGEAVMQLDLSDAPALVFRNSAHGEINVVYRRADGNIGWIDASTTSAKR
jgi:ribosomal subunit interface protein